MRIRHALAGAGALVLASLAAGPGHAVQIQIGDVDSFGFTDLGSLVNAEGNPVDINNDGFIGVGEGLPSLNGDGRVAFDSGDNFDNRSTAEKNDPAARWTDVSLSQGFADGPGEIGAISFTLTFTAPTAGAADFVDHFLTILGGDIGEGSAVVNVDGIEQNLTTFQGAGLIDGGVTLTSVLIPLSVMLDGELVFNFSGGDPFVAIDAMLLAPTQSAPQVVPLPAALPLLGMALGGLALLRARRRPGRI